VKEMKYLFVDLFRRAIKLAKKPKPTNQRIIFNPSRLREHRK
jgi:hypothetical protein